MLLNSLYTKALAANNYGITISNKTYSNLTTLINALLVPIGVIAGIVAFIYLIYSGFLYLTANGNPDQAKKGQSGIVNAVIGIIIIVAAYTILKVLSGSATAVTNGTSL